MKNIILIGMPDSGKSSVGLLISEKLGLNFLDTDLEIKKKFGQTPQEIFATLGEEKFREMESEICKELGKLSDLVISTGGGVVTRSENYDYLKQNGVIYFLIRDIEKIEDKNRPIFKKYGSAEKIWENRKALYFQFADVVVENDDVELAKEKIVEDYGQRFND